MRNEILKFVKGELIGPDPVRPHIQENGEEIIFPIPPRQRYGAGILFPYPDKDGQGSTYSVADSTNTADEEVLKTDADESNVESSKNITDNNSSSNVGDDFEEEIGLANNFLPSAMGFSCFSKIPKKGFDIRIKAAVYNIRDYTYQDNKDKTVTRKAYFRNPLDQDLFIQASNINIYKKERISW